MKCPSCKHVFSRREAICEDWRVKEKCLICPNCNTALEYNKFWSVFALLGSCLSILGAIFYEFLPKEPYGGIILILIGASIALLGFIKVKLQKISNR